ncbi:BON domain-containing protein [Bosea eneae]|uniref:BON domain-containing protein n=1 Tax=Bosea eneae TaxID=151454 RepID=A0ABW0ILU8_9HYPH
MNDLTLHENVISELEFEPSVNAAHIGITAESGMVTLTGHVGSYAEKLAAERVVERFKGVRAIVQNLDVRLPSDRKTDDEDIALGALNVISWDTTLLADEIKVHVQKGWIILTGEVDWQFQRQGAELAVRRLTGVLGVYNWITVKPRVEVRDIKHRIENALMRNAQLEAGQIQVDVSGSHVKLQGNVKAWHERDLAEQAAWAVPGVTSVEDRLAVS